MDLLVPLVAGQLLRITYYTVGLGLVSIVLNVINQLVFYNKKEPPVVFHWVPFIGSTIAYGMDPYQFFFASRAKVCMFCNLYSHFKEDDTCLQKSPVRRHFHIYSPRQEDYGLPWC
jgi:hypothetical protein